MKNQLKKFYFNSQDMMLANEVRTLIDENGVVYFVAKDVCEVLGIEWKGSHTLGYLDDDEKGSHKIGTPRGEQEMLCITESGLYTLILRSNKPEAKRFRRWVTHEVLPAIRETGEYSIRKQLSDLSVFKQEVLSCLKEGFRETSAIARRLDRERKAKQVNTVLRRLVKDGYVEKVAYGVYVVKNNAKKFLS